MPRIGFWAWRCLLFSFLAQISLSVFAAEPPADPRVEPLANPMVKPLTRIQWNSDELESLRGLWIGNLPALPSDKTNAVANDQRAIRFGHQLFFDTRLSSDGQVACATCHLPALAFTDGRKLARGVGLAKRNTMTIIGAAYSPWLFWDGRKDSLWSQALGPLENAVEHGGDRVQYARLIANDPAYRVQYQALFGPLPALPDLSLSDAGASGQSRFPPSPGPVEDATRRAAWDAMAPQDRLTISIIFANLGKAIAAYERLLSPGVAPFDRYVKALFENKAPLAKTVFSSDEEAGLRLFIGRAQCARCHNSALFTNNTFHNTGLADPRRTPPDKGRLIGVKQVLSDEFNCRSQFSDASDDACGELDFIKTNDPYFDRGFKTPTLRNVSMTAPYMHDGRFATLGAVLRHYNKAPRQPIGQTELTPLNLSETEILQLEKFLRTLISAPTAAPFWLKPPSE